MLPSEQDRADVARHRARWQARQASIDPGRLVFIDETWAKTNMTPLRGWAPRGRRLEARVPHGHWKTMTFLAALRCDRITAPIVLDGPINGEGFLAYVEQALVPTLAPGDIVVLDNLGSQGQGRPRRDPGRRSQAPLPAAYSPDPNPIEQVFAKLKNTLRNAAARTIDDTCGAIAAALKTFSPNERQRYLTNSGYASA